MKKVRKCKKKSKGIAANPRDMKNRSLGVQGAG